VVPGIGFSPDKMLQARIFAYPDAHRYRLGANHQLLEVNQPHCPAHHYHRDGQMRAGDNFGAAPNYEPNSLGGPIEDPRFREQPMELEGAAARYDHRMDNDDYTQAGNLYRLMPQDAQQRLVQNIVAGLGQARPEVQRRQIPHFYKADPDYGTQVADLLNIDVNEVMTDKVGA